MIKLPDHCPICASPFMSWIKTLPMKVGGSVELFYCMECESFSSPFSKPSENPVSEVEWHKNVLQRNLEWSKDLLDQLSNKHSIAGNIVDVGCGIGSLLLAAQNKGIAGVGYDIDSVACEYGRTKYGLDLKGEIWRKDSSPDFGLITCISVLEHIHQPRHLIKEMINAAKVRNAGIYISVPFLNRDWWRFIHTDNSDPGHPFEYPHSHVTHFSYRGLEQVSHQFNVQDISLVRVRGGWIGFLLKP